MKIENTLKTEVLNGDMYQCEFLGVPVYIEEGDYIRTKDYGWQEVTKVVSNEKEIHYHIFKKTNFMGGVDIYPKDIIEFRKK